MQVVQEITASGSWPGQPSGTTPGAEISEELQIDRNSWIACRAFGVAYHLDEWGRRVFAHTSPVYVACGGDWTMTDPEGIGYISMLIMLTA